VSTYTAIQLLQLSEHIGQLNEHSGTHIDSHLLAKAAEELCALSAVFQLIEERTTDAVEEIPESAWTDYRTTRAELMPIVLGLLEDCEQIRSRAAATYALADLDYRSSVRMREEYARLVNLGLRAHSTEILTYLLEP